MPFLASRSSKSAITLAPLYPSRTPLKSEEPLRLSRSTGFEARLPGVDFELFFIARRGGMIGESGNFCMKDSSDLKPRSSSSNPRSSPMSWGVYSGGGVYFGWGQSKDIPKKTRLISKLRVRNRYGDN